MGQKDTLSYRVYLRQLPRDAAGSGGAAGAKRISFWHDVPLKSIRSIVHSPIFHYVNEIPRGYHTERKREGELMPKLKAHHIYLYRTNAKYEIAGPEEFNPIRQDTKRGQLRHAKTRGDT